jgi:ubiquinone/menaquinone biosynthesis C-methylase UbiE
MKISAGEVRLLDPTAILTSQLGLGIGQQVGDLGCGGAGYFTLPSARIVGPRGKVYGIDILKSALDGVLSKAKLENLNNIETVWSDLEKVGAAKIPEETLDCALLVNIMFQARQNENILQESYRLLKDGGKLLVIDWKISTTPFGPPLDHRLPPELVSTIAQQVGFHMEKQFEAGAYHYGFIFVR